MKVLNYIKKTVLAGFAAVVLSLIAATGASAQEQYNPNGTPTSKTPVFSNFYDVPNGVGNEADFVRLKPKAGTNADYVSTLNAACNTNDQFTVRTYVHNGADPAGNNNGSGVAVAHNVVLYMTAPLNSDAKSFTFTSRLTSSNAASISDSGVLNCNGKTVRLKLVPNTVQTYSKPLGFQSAPDSAVNGSLPLGSREQGSGNVWACWDDRITVTYDVVVTEVPPAPSVAACVAPTVAIDNNARKVTVTANGSTTNAQIIGYEIDWGDGTKTNDRTASHVYADYGKYTIKTRVQAKYADGSVKWLDGSVCNKEVEFKKPAAPKPVCEAMTITSKGGRTVSITLKFKNLSEAKATIKNITYDFGDGNKKDTKDTTVTYTYEKDGTYKVTAKVVVTIDGKDQAIDTSDCAQQVEFKGETPPTVTPIPLTPLPVTGAGGVAAIFAGVASIIGGAHYFIRRRHL
ncbi:MAG: PKD domain-containing protein [Candidatus Saccharimonadales bacterium]